MKRFYHPIFIAALLILSLFYYLGVRLVQNSGEVTTLASLEIVPSTGKTILGASELFQHSSFRSAEKEHLQVQHVDGQWHIANVAWNKKIDVRTTLQKTRFLKRWAIQQGDTLQIGDTFLQVDRVTRDSIAIKTRSNGRRIDWDNGVLIPSGEEFLYLDCRPWWWRQKFHLRWRLRNGWAEKEITLFSLGGGVNCPDRWKIERLPPISAKIVWRAGRFWLTPGSNNVPILMARKDENLKSFSEQWFPINGQEGPVKRLVIGRTYYAIAINAGNLKLTPVYGNDVWQSNEIVPKNFNAGFTPRYESKNWIGAGTPLSKLFTQNDFESAVILFLACLASVVVWVRHTMLLKQRKHEIRPLIKKLAAVFPAVTGAFFSILLWRAGDTDMTGILFVAWFSWLWTTVLLCWNQRLRGQVGALWLCAVLLAGTGSLTLTQLAAGADNTRWLAFAQKHVFLLMGFAWAMCLISVIPIDWFRQTWLNLVTGKAFFWKIIIRIGLPAFILLIIAAQLFFGGEQGVWGIQPAEAAKLLFVVMAGFVGMHLGELRNKNAVQYQKNPRKYVWDFLKIFLLVGLALLSVLVGVRDISPLLIILVLILAWSWRVAPHPWQTTPAYWANRGAVLFLTASILLLSWWIYQSPEDLPHWVPQGDRFQVWAQPDQHPHSGAQAIQAVSLAGRGCWRGAADSWFGPNMEALKLPAVQNDFIVSFFLYKFGGLAGLVLAGIQLAYLWALFNISGKSSRWAQMSGHYKRREAGNVLGLIIFGLSFIHITQWAISWGNALGLLPVMGQPMTWISAANSHMVFIGLPTLVIAMISGWIADQE